MVACRVCGNEDGNLRFLARETMYGWNEKFAYFQCGGCGCLQIEEIPANLARYYGGSYYSYCAPPTQGRLSRYLKRERAKYFLTGQSLVGRAVSRFTKAPQFLHWVRMAKAGLDDRILDVGCGSGALLGQMRASGFRDLTGLDPFVEERVAVASGLRILRTTLDTVEETFDFVMLNHSFEHLPDPVESLRHVHRLLAPSRMAMVRIPVASSFAWETYGTDWVQLDAPRHVCLHTVRSMELLAKAGGFNLVNVEFDSTAFQFWGSEQCARGIALNSAKSFSVDPRASSFTQSEIEVYSRRAHQLNIDRAGDQAAFYLERI